MSWTEIEKQLRELSTENSLWNPACATWACVFEQYLSQLPEGSLGVAVCGLI
jgi:hypothetical protein